jgi:PAS domain S-box-containing protein
MMNNIEERLRALAHFHVIDTLPEKEFDDIVELASAICGTSISLITLLDSDRQWFKARIGIDDTETPLEHAFCNHAIQTPNEVMVINDSMKDERFKNNPYVTGSPHVRFYAGASLVTNEGVALGTLCVIDDQPRTFTAEQSRLLKVLAERVMRQLELRREMLNRKEQIERTDKELEQALDKLMEAQRIANIGRWDYTIGTKEFTWSSEMYKFFNITREEAQANPDIWKTRIEPKELEEMNLKIAEGIKTHQPVFVEYRIKNTNGKFIWVLGQGSVVKNEAGKPVRFAGTTMDITHRKMAESQLEQYTHVLEETLFSVSHKFRKPVANCLGFAEMLRKGNLSADEAVQCLKFITDGAEELDGYIHELNNFLEQNKVKMNTAVA